MSSFQNMNDRVCDLPPTQTQSQQSAVGSEEVDGSFLCRSVYGMKYEWRFLSPVCQSVSQEARIKGLHCFKLTISHLLRDVTEMVRVCSILSSMMSTDWIVIFYCRITHLVLSIQCMPNCSPPFCSILTGVNAFQSEGKLDHISLKLRLLNTPKGEALYY